MKRFLVILIVAVSTVAQVSALTPAERRLARHALSELTDAQKQYAEAKTKLSAADERAALAEQNAADARVRADQTDERAASLSKEIDTSHANEQRIANENAKMKPVYDKVTRWFGFGAVLYGAKMLVRNVFVLAAVAVVLFFVVSFFFPVVIPAVKRLIYTAISLFSRKR